jgi:hypothetical protein
MTTYVRYFCPHCAKEQYFFTLKPLTTSRWRSRKCRKKFRLDAPGIASTWASAIGLWSMPVAYVATVIACLLAASPGEILTALAAGFLLMGPLMMLCSLILFGIVGYFIGLIYAFIAITK